LIASLFLTFISRNIFPSFQLGSHSFQHSSLLNFVKIFFKQANLNTFVPTTIVYTIMKIEDVIKTKQPMEIASKTVINIVYTSRVIEMATSVFKDFNLTNQQYNVLRILRGQKGKPANLSTLQERMIDRNSNTTRLVDKLIQKKLVTRKVCPENRRKIEILITEKGLSVLKELDPIITEANQKAVKNLNTEELETLNSLLDKLRNDE
tara:strand:- start:1573 stop:2193 length:621 start_codon:yes stop_codon:yes gene_type:complete